MAIPSAERLARLADERGPIRRHLDEAFPPSEVELAAAPSAAAVPPPPPGQTRRLKVEHILIGLVVVYVAAYRIGFGNGFDL